MSQSGVRRAAKFGCPWPTDPLHNIEVMWTAGSSTRPASST
jgi:hypothetical protein